MSDQWRILVVEDDENLNQSIVNSLRKDGYAVQGVRSGAEAIRMLWSEEYDVVIGDLKMPGADGFEMLQWLRVYRPHTRMIMVAAAGSAAMRTQALEGGVVSYLEKPLDLHLLKEELRRLLQQTGFSANLDSFDLLDVIQIITMSRKSIALLVNMGLEERGILRFQGGELIWAEYGQLHGEEAFFALAAHKNGTVTHQLWHEQITPNVTQPLSRLIFQALQYRTKYAAQQQPTGEQVALPRSTMTQEVDDSPFLVLAEAQESVFAAATGTEQVVGRGYTNNTSHGSEVGSGSSSGKEWWQQTGKTPHVTRNGNARNTGDSQAKSADPGNASNGAIANEATAVNTSTFGPAPERKTSVSQHDDLPSWLTEQPTRADLPLLRPSALSNTAHIPTVPVPPPSPAEWRPTSPVAKTTEQLPHRYATGPQKSVTHKPPPKERISGIRSTSASPAEWQPPENGDITQQLAGALHSLSPSHRTSDALSFDEHQESGPLLNGLTNSAKMGITRAARRNYPALVSALQTLGYSIPGFIAAAVVNMDGQPIAQVALDDLDISPLCPSFSSILKSALQLFAFDTWGNYQDTVITSSSRSILLRMVGSDKAAFQVLVTTRESDPLESLEVMANVEGAIAAALG